MTNNKELFLNIHFDKGNGPLVLLIHGVENSGKFWRPLDKVISQNSHCVSVDLLGFGDSPKSPTGLYSLKENVDALENTLSKIHYEEKILLVGHSMGTFVALEFAKRNPSKINKIILTSPVFIFKKGPFKYRSLNEIIQNLFLANANLLRVLFYQLYELVSTSYHSLIKKGVRLIPSIMSIDSLVDKQNTVSQLEALSSIPIYIMYGYFDTLVINSNIKYLCKKFNNIKATKYYRFHDIPHKESSVLISEILK